MTRSGVKFILLVTTLALSLDLIVASGNVCVDYRSLCSGHWLSKFQEKDRPIKFLHDANLEISVKAVYFHEKKDFDASAVCPKRTKESDLKFVKLDQLCFQTKDNFNGNVEVQVAIKSDISEESHALTLEGIMGYQSNHPDKLNKLRLFSRDRQVSILLTYTFMCEQNYYGKFCTIYCDEGASSDKSGSRFKCDTETGEKKCIGDGCEKGRRKTRSAASISSLPIHYRYNFQSRIFRNNNVRNYYVRSRKNNEVWLDKEETTAQYIADSTFFAIPGISGTGVSFKPQNGYYLRHQGFKISTHRFENTKLFREEASWNVRKGLADKNGYSFESVNSPGKFLRHTGYRLRVDTYQNTEIFKNDATFYLRILHP